MITEVRVKLINQRSKSSSSSDDKLLAFCSITLENAFVIRDMKIINSYKGPFVAMPSRKISDRCKHCRTKNHLKANFCNECGSRLSPDRSLRDVRGRSRLHADIAHPINSQARMELQSIVLEEFEKEYKASQQDGYYPQQFDDNDYE